MILLRSITARIKKNLKGERIPNFISNKRQTKATLEYWPQESYGNNREEKPTHSNSEKNNKGSQTYFESTTANFLFDQMQRHANLIY